jgi:hypothetical protein
MATRRPPDPVEGVDPCTGCPEWSRCGSEGLACAAFFSFTSGQLARTWRKLAFEPTQALYDRIFTNEQ